MEDTPMTEVSDARWRDTRWVCTESLEPATASLIASDEPERFRRAVIEVERALARARENGDFSPLHARYSGVMTFFSGRAQLAPDDLRRCAHVSLDALHACSGDVSAQARWGGMATRILETYGDSLALRIEWRPLYDILATYLGGATEAYNGAIPTAVHIAVVSRLAQKARRHFAPDAPAQIWRLLKPKIRALDESACFEGLGLLHLLMPCSRVGKETSSGRQGDGGNTEDSNQWQLWFDEWLEMLSWMPTNRFWQCAWFAIFAQLAKHDVDSRLDWGKHSGTLHTVALWFMEVPVAGGEGGCPFGRRTSSRAAYLFSRSVNDAEQRAKFAAKVLVYRLATDFETENNPLEAEKATAAIEAIMDVLETYAHPSNAGRWTNTVATFTSHAVKYARKRIAGAKAAAAAEGDDANSKPTRAAPHASARTRFAIATTRLIDKGMYSKVAAMRYASASATRDLAYIEPEIVLPLVMSRFALAVQHGTATHQLTAALSVLTSALRPMLVAPPDLFASETFAAVGVFGVGQFLEFVMHATLPGIDANDPSKTLGVVRLYAAVVSNMSVLADPGAFPGNEQADEVFPFAWSDWINALLDRFFVFFENVDPGNAGKADGADKHRGGAGADGGASFLMGSSSMYSPLVRLVFARADPKLRERLVKRVARFVLTSTHSGLTHEVGQMVMAAVTQAPEETFHFLTKPLLQSLTAEVNDVAALAAEKRKAEIDKNNPDDSVAFATALGSGYEILSPTKEAKLRWQTGLLGAALHYGGPFVLALRNDIVHVCDALFNLSASTNATRLGEMAAHVTSLLCGALTGTYITDLFTADCDLRSEIPFPAKWCVSKTVGKEMKEQHTFTPRTFTWRAPGPDELAAAREIAQTEIHAPCRLLMEDPSSLSKSLVRSLLARIGGTASGFRLRMGDFDSVVCADTQGGDSQEYPPRVIGGTDAAGPPVPKETREVAAHAIASVLANASVDDTETIGLALAVAEDILVPSNRDYRGCKAALRTWRADAVALTEPGFGAHDAPFSKTRPRWLLGEYTFLRFLWRTSQSAYHRGGALSEPSEHPAYQALLGEVKRLTAHKYASVRHHARVLVEQKCKRFPAATAALVAPARLALAQTPGDEDRAVASCALLKCTPSVNRMRCDAAHFRATVSALLSSSHHDAEKAQTAINEVFLSVAIRFSRNGTRGGPGGRLLESPYQQSRRDDLDATRDLLYSLMAPASTDQVSSPSVPAPGAGLHWSYALMANALLLMLAHPESFASADAEIARLTTYCMACVLGPTKTLRLPAVCALLMVSRYSAFERKGGGVETLRAVLSQPGTLAKIVANLGLCHHIEPSVSGGGARTSRADALLQAAESMYGAGGDMAGSPWPVQKGGAVDHAGTNEGAHFTVACARLWKLFARVAPEHVGAGLEAPLLFAASAPGDRGARVAAAEALAGVLASPHVRTNWAAPLLLKTVAAAAAEESEEWLRAVRYASRGEQIGEGCEDLLAGVLAAKETSFSSTTAREARRLECALACVAQLTVGDASALTQSGVAFQEALLDELAAFGTPLARDSRAVREEAAKVAGALVGAHLVPSGSRHALDAYQSGVGGVETGLVDPALRSALARLAAKSRELLRLFVASAAEATTAALTEHPAEVSPNDGEGKDDTSKETQKTTDGTGVYQKNWLEGVFLTTIQLAKHGEVAGLAVSAYLADILPTVLRAQETPDRDFSLVAKRCLTYLKYHVFSDLRALDKAVSAIVVGLSDENWHARAAALKLTQAFAFRHAFVLNESQNAKLRTAVCETLEDPQIEVRHLGRDTVVGFLRGTHHVSGSGKNLRLALVKKAKEARGDGNGKRKKTEKAPGSEFELRNTHGASLGLAAVVLSSPHDTPEWLPPVLVDLAWFATGSSHSLVGETVRHAFGEFKKTHQDTWAETKEKFTNEQWEDVAAGMELAPSYIS